MIPSTDIALKRAPNYFEFLFFFFPHFYYYCSYKMNMKFDQKDSAVCYMISVVQKDSVCSHHFISFDRIDESGKVSSIFITLYNRGKR